MAGPDTATADELEQLGRAIVDANLYMVLGTADGAGRPWVSPVYCVPDAYRELIWVSSPEARHSRNLWTLADVEAPARLRLYRATAVEQFVLDEHDRRVSVTL